MLKALVRSLMRVLWRATAFLRRPFGAKARHWICLRYQELIAPQFAQHTQELQAQRQVQAQILHALAQLETRVPPPQPVPGDLNLTLDNLVRELIRLQIQVDELASQAAYPPQLKNGSRPDRSASNS
jgi:hypothetical protein